MKITSIISFILVIIGAINWLLIGVFSIDIVALIFGSMSLVTRIIYSLVGVAGLFATLFLCIYNPFKRV